MQNFKNPSFTPSGLYMKIGSTDSGGFVKFTPKYIIVGVSDFFPGLFLVSRRRRRRRRIC
jgi:hypothetical protein